ncbi:DUF6701 domain-containing protein [Marinobacter subterrani]|uniref:PA14 domain n=1 Tax=Marinobacter subterrani TaxID=1658765 RepID=A0A0J7J6F2_9GAMM|nr:DUF6701 domain-containing protein [Marinobacter subterrani]KMQ73544.1 PA14 domain [Marinobacter subterrani]
MRQSGFVIPLLMALAFFLAAGDVYAAQCTEVFDAPDGLNDNLPGDRRLSYDTNNWEGGESWPASGTQLTSGDYYYDNVTLSKDYQLRIAPGAVVRIFVDGNLGFGKNAEINGAGNPDQLLLVVDGSVGFDKDGFFNGILYAKGKISFDKNSLAEGILASQNGIGLDKDASLEYVPDALAQDLLNGLCDFGVESPLPVFDDFETYTPGTITGLDGGTGWGGSWQGNSGQSIVDTSANPLLFQASNGLSIRSQTTLEVDGNNDRVASRALSGAFSGDQVYLSMLVRFQGAPGNNDFLGFWVQRPGFGDSPQFGVKVNEGGSGNADFFVRLDTSAAYSTDFQAGQTYLLVARFDKNSGNFYDRGRLWVNPQCTDSPPPTPSATIFRNPSNKVTEITELGFRSENLGGGESIQVGQVAAGESWSDVVQCTCYQNGLEATFYNNYQSNQPFPDSPVLTRLDPGVDFDWANGSPDPVVDDNDFAVQWQGAIEVPETGMYEFRTRTDDGVRLWVEDLTFGAAVIDDWNDQSAADNTSDAVRLEAGRRYAIRMQFYENGGQAVAELQWNRPGGGGFEIIPEANLFACLPVSAPTLQSASAVCGASDLLRVKFDQSSRTRMLDGASVEDTSFYSIEALGSGASIGVESASLESSGYSVLLNLSTPLSSEETYEITVSDIQDVGGVAMSPNPATVEFEASSTGLSTFYWNNRDLNGPTVAQEVSATIDEDYGGGSPIPGTVNNDRFSIRWTGYIVPAVTGDYRFRTRTDDGVRLWVQDLSNPIINEWVDQSPTNHESGVLTLQQGQAYALKMEMYENGGGAVAQLFWDTPASSGFEVVPASALFNCPEAANALDHFRIISGGNSVTCSPAPVTIQASDANGQPVTDYTGTVNLSTSTGLGDWLAGTGAGGTLARGSGNSGRAAYSFSAADSGVVTLNLRHTLADTVNVNVADGSTGELDSFDPDIVFAETGFIFHQAGDLGSQIQSLVAGKDSSIAPGGQNLQLTAVRTNDDTGACEAFLTGPQDVEVGYVCESPGTCALTDALRVNGQTVASNNNGGISNTGTVSLDFGDSSTSSASLVLNYADAGRLSLFARKPLLDAEGNPTGGEIAGSSNAFVSVPAGFCITATDTNSGCTGDPANCSVLTSAGSDFPVSYQAVAWQQAGESGAEFCIGNPVTPAFERLNINIAHELVAPAGGETGTFAPQQSSFSSGGGGTSDQLQRISEVGVFKIRIPEGQSYLGNALPGGKSASIGRFIPARFGVTLASAGEIGPACVGTPGFTYTGQDSGWQVEPEVLIAALNEQDEVTTNYTRGDFQKLQAADVLRALPDTDSSQQQADNTGPLDVTVSAQPANLLALTTSPGRMAYEFSSADTLTYPKTKVSQVAPFNPSLTFAINQVVDSDNVSGATSLPISFQPLADLDIRYGRWFMENVYGPETIPELEMPFQAQYWAGARFELNEVDNCSVWDTTNVTGTTDHHSLVAASGTLSSGTGGPLVLEPDGSQGTDTLIWEVPVWLQHFWNDAATLQNPTATATFGVYRGHDRVIYWQER